MLSLKLVLVNVIYLALVAFSWKIKNRRSLSAVFYLELAMFMVMLLLTYM